MGKYTIGESKEDYLKTILTIQNLQGFCKAIDVASALGYSKASVSVAIKKMIESDEVIRNNEGNIILTDKGYRIAENTLAKHNFLLNLLIQLGVSKNIAEKDACELEHVISEQTYSALKGWIK